MTDDPRLGRRIREVNAGLTIPLEVRRRQRAAVQAELAGPPTLPPARPGAERKPPRIALVAATLLILPGAAAVASAGAVPGDTLYSTKLAVERVVSVIDDDVMATHRLDELERLIDRDSPVSVVAGAQDDAAAALDQLDAVDPLRVRYRSLVLGGRGVGGGLEPGYRLDQQVDWRDGGFGASLPGGSILRVDPMGSDFRVEVGDGWRVDRLSDRRWYVSQRVAGGGPGPVYFDVEVSGDRVVVVLLDDPPVVPEPDRSSTGVEAAPDEARDQDPVADESEDPSEAGEAEAGDTEVGEVEPGAGGVDAGPAPTVAPNSTAPTSTGPTTTRPPSTTTTKAPTTTGPATTAKPTTTRPTTTTTRPTTTTTRPTTTTICDDDDDLDDAGDDDDCDD